MDSPSGSPTKKDTQEDENCRESNGKLLWQIHETEYAAAPFWSVDMP